MMWQVPLVMLGVLLAALAVAVLVAAGRQRRRLRGQIMHERFLAALCHELRTPLNAMAGSVSMLRSSSMEARSRAMAILERNVRVEAGLIDELLEASELLAGQTTPRFAPVDLAGVFEAAVSRMLLFAQHRGVNLTCSAPDHGVIVAADRRHLGQVATHLVSHAIRCARPGGSVHIECADTNDAARVQLTTHSRLSESGWHAVIAPLRTRLPDALCDDRSLGLSVVREILAMHGGDLGLARTGAAGMVWTITLPARVPGVALDSAASAAEASGRSA